ncbi:hypothetical protein C7212DRAFT_356579 [Tuber magnatum]|uniref:Uncharacterized protein n=1 Tax=Tuber magnatum TaxID=42249 RepID=A0A317T152_9PEZI|nr:hypothetical protein C7212DRAFT_356579 [Tuber magnatum]
MPSAGRSLPTTRTKSWRLQRPHDKGNIAKGDQEKYQHKLTTTATNTASSSSPSQPSSPPLPLSLLPMETTKTTTMHLPTPLQGKTPGGGGDFVQLFDPKVLDGIDLNDPVRRTEWVQAVWEYFHRGGRWNPGRRDGEREAGDESMGDEWIRDRELE